MAHFSKRSFSAKRAAARGTGGLHRPMRVLIWMIGVFSLPLFPAIATAATQIQNPAIGLGIASITLLVMAVVIGFMWRRFARQALRPTRPRWEDWR